MIYRDVASELAEFFLEEVTPAQGGSYRCCYRRLSWGPGVWSHPSDTLELLVTGEVWGGGRGMWRKDRGGMKEGGRERDKLTQ